MNILADSGYFVGLFQPKDHHHDRCKAFFSAYGGITLRVQRPACASGMEPDQKNTPMAVNIHLECVTLAHHAKHPCPRCLAL